MEQIVLGIFQEQLSKVIVDFRKEQVNANLLNGKGEITDISLNCQVINEQLSRMTPFIEFEEIHVSRLGFHVTSWTNIRQAPIVVDIGTITARVNEPLQCLPRHQRKRIQMLTLEEIEKMIKEGFKPLRGNGSYGLADRIVDNMTIEMECFRLDVQTWGRFKTKRRGIWTPPMLQVEYNNLKVVMVDEDGNEASPDQVWAHNRGKRQHFMIYKKVKGECVVRLVFHPGHKRASPSRNDTENNVSSNDSISNKVDTDDNDAAKNTESSQSSSSSPASTSPQTLELARMEMEVQAAVRRRLKDGAFLAVQVDTTIPKVECRLDSEGVHQLAHLVAGMQFCFAKDRSFDDPLKPRTDEDDGGDDHHHHTPHGPTIKMLSRLGSTDTAPDDNGDEDNQSNGDDANKSSDDNNSFDLSRVDGGGSVTDGDAASTASGSMIDGASVASSDDENLTFDDGASSKDGSFHGMSRRRRIERPVILLPNGLVIYSSISLTCSVHEFDFIASYPEKPDSFIKFEARGCVTEALWPKVDNEHGLYAQMSTAYVALQERYETRTRTLLLGGMQRDDHLSHQLPSSAPRTIGADNFFPLFERRWIRDDPIDLRHLFPTQAFGIKTTISLTKNENDLDEDDKYMVLHEMGVDEMDIVLDTSAVQRMSEFFLGKNGKPLDLRWQTGDWTDVITPNMLSEPSETLVLDDYLQHPKLILLDENFMPSSDLFNITAKFTNVEMKIPAAIQHSLRSCDLSMKWKETTIVVSSLLPRTFLSGRIGSGISNNSKNDDQNDTIDFPNDPSDICYSLEEINSNSASDEVPMSTFRFQFTTNGFEMVITPIIPFCKAIEPRRLISLSNSTAIFCFEGRPPVGTKRDVTITMFLSILVHELVINIDLELFAGVLITLLHHGNNIEAVVSVVNELYPMQPKAQQTELDLAGGNEVDFSSPLSKSMKGRKIMVQRRLSQSRETGGLSIVFCMQENDLRIRIWRQNVSQVGPLRGTQQVENNSMSPPGGDRLLEALKIGEFEMKGFEAGIEFDFHGEGNYRTVFKSFLEKTNLRLCNIENSLVAISHPEEAEMEQQMIDIVFFGMDALPGAIQLSGKSQQFALRMEGQHKKQTQSWSMAADMTSPALVCLHARAIMDASIQMLEALLLPSFSAHPSPMNGASPFPPGTLGSLFFSAIKSTLGEQQIIELSSVEISDTTNDPIVERYLRSLCKMVLPSNVDVILLHCEVGNLLMSIPEDSSNDEASKDLSLLLHQAEIISRFYPAKGTPPCSIENVLACKGMDWSTLIDTSTDGLFLRFSARQSLLVCAREAIEKVIQPFEVSTVYAGGKVNLSMNEDFLIDDIRLIERFQSRLKSAVCGSIESLSHVATIISAMNDRISENAEIEEVDSEVDPREQNDSGFAKSLSEKSHYHLQNSRQFLELLDKEVRLYHSASQSVISRRDEELEAAKISIFKKERERIGLLSIMSSQVAGWIRVGGRHRTGQRVARKTLVWPYYAVLRKDLMILYSSPSSAKPLDVISLQNTTIRLLAGGRSKQDIKRAFALIESSGLTRYFVSQSAQEFNLWTREIVAAIRTYSSADFEFYAQEVSETNGDDTRLSFGEDFRDDSQNDDGDENKRRIGTRLSSAYQSVRMKGKEISERRRMRSSEFGSDVGEESSYPSQNNSIVGESIEEETRRAQIGKKLTVVGQVTKSKLGSAGQATKSKLGSAGQATKNKLGSALHSARQKGAELSSRRSRNQDGSSESQDGSDDIDPGVSPPESEGNTGRRQFGAKLGSAIQNVRTKAAEKNEKGGRFSGLRGKLGGLGQARVEDPSGPSTPRRSPESSLHNTDDSKAKLSWTCAACTFLNGNETDACEMCGSNRQAKHPDPPLEGSSNESETRESLTKSEERPMISDAVDETQNPQTTTGSEIEENTTKASSPRFSLKKREEDILDDSVFGGRNTALRNVRPSHMTPSAVRDPSLNIEVPLKRFEKQWNVTVTSFRQRIATAPTATATPVQGGTDTAPAEDDDVSTSAGADHVSTEDIVSHETKSNNDHPDSDPVDAVPEESSKQTQRPADVAVTIQQSFLIRVHDCQKVETFEAPLSEKVLSLGDILIVYSQISESIENVLSQLIPARLYEEEEADLIDIKTPNSRSLLAEKVLVSGRILGGLLGGAENQSLHSDGFHHYQSEVIEYFINSVLACPLPIDTLVTISEAIGISSSSQDVPVETSASKESTASLTNLDSQVSKILSLLSASQTELHRIELGQHAASHRPSSNINQQSSSSKDKTSSYPFAKSLLHEPLMPSSLTNSIHESMHESLMKLMSERDEAHAKLIGGNVLSIHKVERERKKSERLEYDARLRREIARIQIEKDLQHPNLGNLFGNQEDRIAKMRQEIDKKIEAFQTMISTNGDEEMMQLCSQLSVEISAKTSNELELERLKSLRVIEKKTEEAERKSLEEELQKVKHLLAMEQEKNRVLEEEKKLQK